MDSRLADQGYILIGLPGGVGCVLPHGLTPDIMAAIGHFMFAVHLGKKGYLVGINRLLEAGTCQT